MSTHPVDRLYELRQQIAQLRQESHAIRAQILRGEVESEGKEHAATVERRIVLKSVRTVG